MKYNISNIPPKGMSDWYPIDFAKRKYIFDIYRDVCTRFGYQEYLTPTLEFADLYRAKSGEDVGEKELWTLRDKSGREYAIRPEMTPSVTRMVSRIYKQETKPIRYFSIANFMRNEKPQRGRSREFWQLNYDLFGVDSTEASIETIQVSMEILLAFNPPKDSFTMFINNRELIDTILDEFAKIPPSKKTQVVRILDKWEKLERYEFEFRLKKLELNKKTIENLILYMESQDEDSLAENFPKLTKTKSYLETIQLLETLKTLGYEDWIEFNPSIIRGFDYYDKFIFEVYDNSPKNNRSIFGGGTYNGLASIFGQDSFPATGAGPGELPVVLFLEEWGLFPKNLLAQKTTIYVPIIDKNLSKDTFLLANNLRRENKNLIIENGVEEERISKALSYADNKSYEFVVIFGSREIKQGIYKLKNMKSGEEKEYKLDNYKVNEK